MLDLEETAAELSATADGIAKALAGINRTVADVAINQASQTAALGRIEAGLQQSTSLALTAINQSASELQASINRSISEVTTSLDQRTSELQGSLNQSVSDIKAGQVALNETLKRIEGGTTEVTGTVNKVRR